MATSKGGFAVLDIQNDDQELSMDLQFQDFGDTRTQPAGGGGGGSNEQTIIFTEFPDTAEEDQENDKLMGDGEGKDSTSPRAGASFWTFEFYQQFFDVESKQVGDRILWSMVPKPGVSYLQSYIRPNPDLYGPFWICVTLTFATAITGNMANYIATSGAASYIWRYDFSKVTLAASAIFAYAWLVPLSVWGVLALRGSRAKISLLELLCIYGYSLAIFIPVSILWIVPQPWFKWCLAIVAPVLSGSVLVRTVWPSLSHDSKQVAIGIAVVILLLHATLALGFVLYFFTPPESTADNVPAPPVPHKGDTTTLNPKKSQEDNKTKTESDSKGNPEDKENRPPEKPKKDDASAQEKPKSSALKVERGSPDVESTMMKDLPLKDTEKVMEKSKGSKKPSNNGKEAKKVTTPPLSKKAKPEKATSEKVKEDKLEEPVTKEKVEKAEPGEPLTKEKVEKAEPGEPVTKEKVEKAKPEEAATERKVS